VRYVGKGTERLHKSRQEIQGEHDGVLIPAKVRWLSNYHTIIEREQSGDNITSSEGVIVKGKNLAHGQVSTGVTAVGVLEKVDCTQTQDLIFSASFAAVAATSKGSTTTKRSAFNALDC
jgi:hypothetical protein